ncbi:MAG TPA: energy transducer TonB [Vicinamibacteria bacterium]|nr:energy transducer TonB [Vicinamibacteria bacterium]
MNDPVDRVIVEREEMDRGFPAGVIVSVAAHLAVVVGSVLVAMLAPAKPLIDVVHGMAVPLPPGGGGRPAVEPPAAAPQAPEPAAEPPKPEPVKPQVIRPPKEAPRKGLPEPDAKPQKKKPTPQPAPARAAGAAGGSGTSTDPVGIGIGPPGPGVPGGTDLLGDWYLAGVQRKIYALWVQQIRPEFQQPVAVTFAILADGSVTDVTVVQSSGISLIDRAAQRAVVSSAPFGPLPRTYGTDRYTIQAVFRPTS